MIKTRGSRVSTNTLLFNKLYMYMRFHIIPFVTPSGFDFVGNRYRGFRFAPFPAVIYRSFGAETRESRVSTVYIVVIQ